MNRSLFGTERLRDATLGLCGTVLVLALMALGIQYASGAFDDGYDLVAYVDRAGFGVDTNSTVKVRGVTVGQVSDVEFVDAGRVRLTLAMNDDIQIPTTATASVEPLSVFGPKFINLEPCPDLAECEAEMAGPFLPTDDTGEIAESVTPSEVIETLEQVAVLLAEIDTDNVEIVIGELAQGFDGLGDEFGILLDNSTIVADRALANQDAIDALLADTRRVLEAFEGRTGQFIDTAESAAELLEIAADNEDPITDLLTATSELSINLSDVLAAGSDDLGAVLAGLDPVSELLVAQLGQVPGLLDTVERVFAFLADDVLVWDRGDGKWGGVVQGPVNLDLCEFFGLGC